MKDAAHDPQNEEEDFPFQSLAAITARALRTQQNENAERPERAGGGSGQDGDGADHTQENEKRERDQEQHRAYVTEGLRKIAAFERIASGQAGSRKRIKCRGF